MAETPTRKAAVLVLSAPPDGGDWPDLISQELAGRDLLAGSDRPPGTLFIVIGPSFAAALPGQHFLQLIVANAQSKQRPIIPILVDGACMPDESDLPAQLRTLKWLEAITIDSVRQVGEAVTKGLAAAHRQTGTAPPPDESSERSVFIAYRRDDAGYWADVLGRALTERFDRRHVFLDVGSQQVGVDYHAQIMDALDRATDVVVVIGHGFLEPDADSTRRIDDPTDELRTEIRTALQAGKRMHAVLAPQATLPEAATLPVDIADFAETESTHTIRSKRDAFRVANEMFPPTLIESPMAPLLSPATRERFKAFLEPTPSNSRELAYRRHAESILEEMALYGWTDVKEDFDQDRFGTFFTVESDQFPGFSFDVLVGAAAVCLNERVRSGLRAGLPRWVTRCVFPVSPEDSTAAGAMRLPADLLEAAMDPRSLLDRVGRVKLDITNHLLVKNEVSRGRDVTTFGTHEPNALAVRAYQKTRRAIAATGGLTTMRSIMSLELATESEFGIAFHPDGHRFAMVSSGGAHLVKTSDWTADSMLTSSASWQAAGFSADGWLALVSDHDTLSVWDSGGRLVVDRVAPPGKRTLRKRWKRDHTISQVSWSSIAPVVASCDQQGVWTYDPTTERFASWAFPIHTAMPFTSHDRAAQFQANGDAVLVHGLESFAAILQMPDLHVDSVLERPRRQDQLIADRDGARSGGLPFFDILSAAPDLTGDRVILGGSEGWLALYDIPSWDLVEKTVWFEPVHNGHEARVGRLSLSPDGCWLAAAAVAHRLVIGDARTLEPRYKSPETLGFLTMPAPRLAWSPDSKMVAVQQRPGRVEIFGLDPS